MTTFSLPIAVSSFDILNRQQTIHRNIMLEASAGTGKTFTIENLLVRLLIEANDCADPMLLNRILVVTFTKAAARDLKVRIRANLEKALFFIKRFQADEDIEDPVPDYLLAHQESGRIALMHAQRRIESALYAFDQTQIFTIHGFCWRMLQAFAIEGGISLESFCSEEQMLNKTRLLQVVRDFMRTELVDEAYSWLQISRVLQMFGGQSDRLQSELLQAASRGMDIANYPSYMESAKQFFSAMKSIKAGRNFASEKILSDFMQYVPTYRGICNRSKQIHPHILNSVTHFAQLFDKEDWTTDNFDELIRDGLVLLKVLAPEQLAAKGVVPAKEKLHYPDLLPLIESTLAPIINQARDPHIIFARMAGDCQALLRHYQTQEEILGFNDLLQQMQQVVARSPSFTKHTCSCFDAVIVDEFQDTDPVQWEIFRRLFATSEWPGYMYLVGDPKQSIYAFRQADIYTYLSAAQTLEDNVGATLDTNYRSQPSLVKALNVLFESGRDLFPLPYQQQLLPYRSVKAGRMEEKRFSDHGACLQFLIAQAPVEKNKKIILQKYEDDYFFPRMAKEIIRLHVDDGVKFNRCAILVADRFQSERLVAFFQEAGIPVISQRGNSLADSIAVHAMRELLQGILHYRHDSLLRVALGGNIIGMSHEEILALDELENYEEILHQCEQLRKIFLEEGFALFYPRLMYSCWHKDGKNVLQRILERYQGIEFYREWQDIAELLIEEQALKNLSAEGVIDFLNDLDMLVVNEDERIKQSMDHEQEGVTILTSHVSKGLEFDIVFALGLIKRSPQKEKLMPVQNGEYFRLEVIKNKSDPIYVKYCEEVDAEKMRQLYVAMTRAKHRLYIPIALSHNGEEVEIGTASPIELFLARLGNKSNEHEDLDYNELYARVQVFDVKLLYDFVAECGADISISLLEESVAKSKYSTPEAAPELQPQPEFKLEKTPIFMQSFSSLVHTKLKSEQFIEEVITLAPHDFNALIKSAHTLPAGNDTGILLHAILESLPFDKVKTMNSSEQLLPWINPLILNTSWEPWSNVLMSMVYHALKTPLPDTVPSFCLADVNPKKMLREADFLYSSQSPNRLESVPFRQGYIKGVIDLFFEYEGKYYLLDWKSNWLGATEESYHSNKLEEAMKENDYHLQAKIYIEALRKYLKIFDDRLFETLFGGVYYLFLRGIGPQTGIWH